ncbi:MAG: hypothetical protein PVH29_11895 [Candidatus Zixiibacteriota bacterium]|jgi:hypothetical protein
MNEEQRKTAFVFGAEGDEIVEQFRSLVELARWSLVVLLAVYSFIIPIFGIIFGLILMKFAAVPKNRGLGKLCLILGIVAIVLVVACWIISFVVGMAGSLLQ